MTDLERVMSASRHVAQAIGVLAAAKRPGPRGVLGSLLEANARLAQWAESEASGDHRREEG